MPCSKTQKKDLLQLLSLSSLMAETEGFVYDTLDALTQTGDHDELVAEPYEVFRNLISAPGGPAADIPGTDYFSLDVSAPASDTPFRNGTPSSSSFASRPSSAASSRGSELAWFRAGSRFRSPMLQLHQEILDFCDFISPTPEEQASRVAALQRVSEVVKYIWPHSRVEVFGSFKTGLYLPTSDIDVVIMDSKVKTPRMGLYALSRALSQRCIGLKMQVIAKARVPIIKFVEKTSGVAFDISFDMDSGPKAAKFIKDVLNRFPPLRPLCMIMKVFLQQRELNEVYLGGVGSYALLTMLIAHLQIHWREELQGSQYSLEHNLGILLVNFFDFYGRKLNTCDIGVSCNLAGTFFLKRDRGFSNTERPYLLSIEDPQDPDNDIGRNSFNYFKIRSAFAMAYSSLTDTKTIISLGSQRSILGTIIRPDSLLLDRRGGSDGALKFNALLLGAGAQNLSQFGSENDVLYNWKLDDDEPLPREKLHAEDETTLSTRKVKSSKPRHKSSGNEDLKRQRGAHEENRDGRKAVKKVVRKIVKKVIKKHRKDYGDDGEFAKSSLRRHSSRSG